MTAAQDAIGAAGAQRLTDASAIISIK